MRAGSAATPFIAFVKVSKGELCQQSPRVTAPPAWPQDTKGKFPFISSSSAPGLFLPPIVKGSQRREKQSLSQEAGIQSDRDLDKAVRYSGVETESQGVSYTQKKRHTLPEGEIKETREGSHRMPTVAIDFSSLHTLMKSGVQRKIALAMCQRTAVTDSAERIRILLQHLDTTPSASSSTSQSLQGEIQHEENSNKAGLVDIC